jgi:hypothetical protein
LSVKPFEESFPTRDRSPRDAAIEQFVAEHLPGPNEDLYREMVVTLARLNRDDAGRGDVKLLHKAMQEIRYGFKVFAPYRETRKISIFGSSRTREDDPDYVTCQQFARRMCDGGWMVITGAGDGIMKAGHGGAGVEKSFGVAIRLPFEQKTNSIIADDPKLVNFRYFFTRKLTFLRESHASALFPGGFGTQDEGFEVLVLIQTGKAPVQPVVMLERPGGSYWQHWRKYVEAELLRTGMISEQDMSLFYITDNVDDALREVTQFYRVYHSQRYVADELVLRLNQPPTAELVERLNDEFGDIIEKGRIEPCTALPVEAGHYEDKPRLKLRFDRRNYGRLRQMIDAINRDGQET